LDQQALQNFDKLRDLVSALDQPVHEAYFQQFVELYALTIAASTSSSQSVHPISVGPTSSVISTTHPVVSQIVTQHIPTNPTSTPPIRPYIMVACYAPLVLPT